MYLFSNFSKDKVFLDEPLSKHSSFKIGGPADILIIPDTKEELLECVEICTKNKTPFFILGRGSNILFTDKGVRGVVIKTTNLKEISKTDDNLIYAQAGVNLSALANFLLKENLAGFEFASGIPGNLGGAIYMNAGAYGEELKDVIHSVEVIRNNKQEILTNQQMLFDYRHSIAQEEDIVILGAYLSFVDGDPEAIKQKSLSLNKKRIQSQPLDMPNAGSTFRRPENNFAGKLVEDIGLKGYAIGGAQVSEKHAGFIVNTGDATAQDVMDLVEYIKKEVYAQTNVRLVEELKIIGER